METKRQVFLDIAKGIGIIFVLFSHSCGFPIFGNAIVDFYMPLFFFITGYVYRPGRCVKDNIKRKLKQLLIPYAGYTFILYLEHIATGWIKQELTTEYLVMPIIGALYSRAALYADMSGENIYFLIINNGVMWFITAMAMAGIFYYLLVETFLSDGKKRMAIGGILIALTIGMAYCPYLLPWSLDIVPACTLFMLVGAFLGQNHYYSEENKTKYNFFYILIVALTYGVVTEFAEPVNISIREYGYPGALGAIWFVLVAMAGVLIFLWICKYLEKISWMRYVALIGRHTFSIMALHILLFKYLTKVYYWLHMTFLFHRTCIWYWIYWIIVFAVVIVFCIVFDLLIQKVRDLKVLRRK